MATRNIQDPKGKEVVRNGPAERDFSKVSSCAKPAPERRREIGFNEQRMLNADLRRYSHRVFYVSQIREVKRLIKAGADVNSANSYGWTALMSAAKGVCTKVAKLLIEKGADVNAKDVFGVTALMVAAKTGEPAVVKLLIEKGADVNARDEHGRTLLEHVQAYQRDALRALIKENEAKK